MNPTQPPVAAATPLKGHEYRAVVRLSTGDDHTLADVGETCDHVPAESLPGLLLHGYIEHAKAPARKDEAPA